MFYTIILAAGIAVLSFNSGMAQAACPSAGPPPVAGPLSVGMGAVLHITPIDQNCVPIPNDANNIISLVQVSGLATWALNAAGGVDVTGVAVGSMPTVQIRWHDQYTTHPNVQSPIFTINVVAPAATVTAVGSTSP
jgi:hypothetical protein